jgi:hypothetical protein
MALWFRSDTSQAHVGGVVSSKLLCPRGTTEEWFLLGRKEFPAPRDDYIVSFVRFHERRFTVPPHPFLRGLLHH